MMSHSPKALCLLLATISLARASTILHTVDGQAYREEAALFLSVGKVNGSGISGSGVLISDRWVLTAGHVSLSKVGATYNVGGVNYTVQRAITHPSFSFSGPSYDLGLLYLSEAVVGVSPATMIRLNTPSSILGREATWVGHGLTGTGLTGAQSPLGSQAFTNIIDFFGDRYDLSPTSFVADFDAPDGTGNASGSTAATTRLEGNVAAGDSGGGVFVTVDGVRYLVGINSYAGGFAVGTNSKYGSISGAASLHQFHSWIYDVSGVTAIPEPGVFGLLCLGAMVGLFRRRAGSAARENEPQMNRMNAD